MATSHFDQHLHDQMDHAATSGFSASSVDQINDQLMGRASFSSELESWRCADTYHSLVLQRKGRDKEAQLNAAGPSR